MFAATPLLVVGDVSSVPPLLLVVVVGLLDVTEPATTPTMA